MVTLWILLVVVVYLLPLLLAFWIGIKPLRELIKEINEHGPKVLTMKAILAKFTLKQHFQNTAKGDLSHLGNPMKHRIYKFLTNVALISYAPVFALKFTYMMAKDPLVNFKLLVDPNDAFNLILLSIAAAGAYCGHTTFGAVIALWVVIHSFLLIMVSLDNQKGYFNFQTKPSHGSVFSAVPTGAIIIGAFAVAFYAASLEEGSMQFGQVLSFADAIYFSLVTAATVGYGDIVPKGGYVKFLVMVEIAFAWVYTVIVVTTILASLVTKSLENVRRMEEETKAEREQQEPEVLLEKLIDEEFGELKKKEEGMAKPGEDKHN